ncbi:hypothetical protein ES332_A05G265000v1 [Gossypium tomentosum]|uniref:Uncharacterized protein n=1 Tax=Gossypium tomentosum TaxID=34277 RepID=A0A5D2QMZ2_GOSTO|nr:hypothetical protein ES332_A05G265000v1 [Gossypium tomentosum]
MSWFHLDLLPLFCPMMENSILIGLFLFRFIFGFCTPPPFTLSLSLSLSLSSPHMLSPSAIYWVNFPHAYIYTYIYRFLWWSGGVLKAIDEDDYSEKYMILT